MHAKSGLCPNFGGCATADSREIVSIPPGAEFRCPECNSTLQPAPSKGATPMSATTLGVLGGTLLLVVLGVSGWVFLAHGHGRVLGTASTVPTTTYPAVSTPGSGSSPALLTNTEWNRVVARVQGPLVDEPISFQPGQTRISDDDEGAIRDSLSKLDQHPHTRILVEAHVDKSDSPQEDQALSDERALEVKRFLTQDCGLPPDRVLAKGCGSDHPPERVPDEAEQHWKRRSRSVRILLVGE